MINVGKSQVFDGACRAFLEPAYLDAIVAILYAVEEFVAGRLLHRFGNPKAAVIHGKDIGTRTGAAVTIGAIDNLHLQFAGKKRLPKTKVGDIAVPVGLGVVGDGGCLGRRRVGGAGCR